MATFLLALVLSPSSVCFFLSRLRRSGNLVRYVRRSCSPNAAIKECRASGSRLLALFATTLIEKVCSVTVCVCVCVNLVYFSYHSDVDLFAMRFSFLGP
jgi:hypothetical protein